MEVRAGQRVVHPDHGEGTVLTLRDRGRVRVRFDGRALTPVTIPGRELTPQNGGAGAAAKGGGESAAAPAAEERDVPDLRQAIEALRLGVVPRSFVRDYTVARETELAAFEALLGEGEGLRLLWGDYGTGKTHLLDVYETMALAAGWVTSRVTLDPRETPPSHPQRLFCEIVRSLRYPDDPGEGLDPLFLKLADSPDHRRPRGKRSSRVLSPVLYAFSHPESEAASWAEDYVGGYPMDTAYGERELARIGWRGARPLALSDYRTYGRMYVHLVGTLSAWAADAGYKGLVVLFDEVEYIDMVRGEAKDLAKEVLQHYAAVTLPRARLAFDPGKLYRGGHAVHRAIPLKYTEDQRLVVLMALTPLPEAQEVARKILADHEEDLDLTPLRARDYAELVGRIGRLYARAYPGFAVPDATAARIAEAAREQAVLGDVRPREIVRRTVLELDAARLGARR